MSDICRSYDSIERNKLYERTLIKLSMVVVRLNNYAIKNWLNMKLLNLLLIYHFNIDLMIYSSTNSIMVIQIFCKYQIGVRFSFSTIYTGTVYNNILYNTSDYLLEINNTFSNVDTAGIITKK